MYNVGVHAMDWLQKLIGPAIFGMLLSMNSDISKYTEKAETMYIDMKEHWVKYDKTSDTAAEIKSLSVENSRKIIAITDIVRDIKTIQEDREDTIKYMNAVKAAGGWPLTIDKEPKK